MPLSRAAAAVRRAAVRRASGPRRALSSPATGDAAELVRTLGGLRGQALGAAAGGHGDVHGRRVVVRGWVRSVRAQKRFSFVSIGDGTSQHGLQVVVPSCDAVKALRTGCSVEVEGVLSRSDRERPPQGQEFELQAEAEGVRLVGACDEDYPLQKKHHSLEFLRDVAHVRMRSNTIGAAMRVRNAAMMALHEYLQREEFLMVNTPVITPLDCEGAGELFGVSHGTAGSPPFFGRPAYLGVSGQLYGEMAASSLSRVYTFGPTFRAENSHTTRHVAEFWMLEPEVAHAGLPELLELSEGMVRHAMVQTAERCAEDLEFCNKRVRPGLAEETARTLERPFAAMTYTEAVEVLQRHSDRFEEKPEWGCDLRSEHERFLAEQHCQAPVFVTDYPSAAKPFYMKPSEGAAAEQAPGDTVACFDLLVPHVGEVIGGSVREDRADALEERMRAMGLDAETYKWYLDLRRYGSVPHGGFGLGFERFVQMITGIANIRDVSPVPRTPGAIHF